MFENTTFRNHDDFRFHVHKFVITFNLLELECYINLVLSHVTHYLCKHNDYIVVLFEKIMLRLCFIGKEYIRC